MQTVKIQRVLSAEESDGLVGSGVDYNDVHETLLQVDFNGTLRGMRLRLQGHFRDLGIDQKPDTRAAHYCVMHHGCVPGSSGADCPCTRNIRKPPQVRVLGSNFELHADGSLHEVSDTENDRTSTLLELGLVPGHKVQVFYVPPDVIEV